MCIRVKAARREKQTKKSASTTAASHGRMGKPGPADDLLLLLTAWERMEGNRKIFSSS